MKDRCLGDNQRRQSSGRDRNRASAQLVRNPPHKALDHSQISVEKTGLYRVHRGSSNDRLRLLYVDSRESRGALEQRVCSNLRPGTDDASQVLSLDGDRVERRRRPEVGDNQRLSANSSVLFVRSDGRSYRIGMPALVRGSTTSGSHPK